jgi:hypothetical protein
MRRADGCEAVAVVQAYPPEEAADGGDPTAADADMVFHERLSRLSNQMRQSLATSGADRRFILYTKLFSSDLTDEVERPADSTHLIPLTPRVEVPARAHKTGRVMSPDDRT